MAIFDFSNANLPINFESNLFNVTVPDIVENGGQFFLFKRK